MPRVSYEIVRPFLPSILIAKTINLPLAELEAPPIKDKELAPVVVVENEPVPAFPPNEVTSFPDVAVIQVLEPLVPFK